MILALAGDGRRLQAALAVIVISSIQNQTTNGLTRRVRLSSRTQPRSLRPGEAPEGGGERDDWRSPASASGRQRGHHLGFVAALLRMVDRSCPSTARPGSDHRNRDDSPRLTAANRTCDERRRRTQRPGDVEQSILNTTIFVRGQRTPPSRSITTVGDTTPTEAEKAIRTAEMAGRILRAHRVRRIP